MAANRYEPLLHDIQNLISSETKDALDTEEKNRRALLDYAVGFCAHPTPTVPSIFDFHFRQDSHRTPKESPCDCGFGHYLNGEEYDWVVKFIDIRVGLKRGDHPETVFEKALIEHDISSPYKIAEKYCVQLRQAYHNFRDTPPEIPIDKSLSNSANIPFIPLVKPKKRIKISEDPPRSKVVPTPVEVKKETPEILKQNASEVIKPTTKTSSSGMEEYKLRQREKMRQQQEETKKKQEFIQDLQDEMETQRVVVKRDNLSMFGVPDVSSDTVLFVVNGIEVGSIGFQMGYSHTVAHLRIVLDKLLKPSTPYRLILTKLSQGLPMIIEAGSTLQDAGITQGGNIIMIPDVSPKFP